MNNLSYFLDTCPDFIKEKFIYTKFNTFEKILKQNDKPSFAPERKKLCPAKTSIRTINALIIYFVIFSRPF